MTPTPCPRCGAAIRQVRGDGRCGACGKQLPKELRASLEVVEAAKLESERALSLLAPPPPPKRRDFSREAACPDCRMRTLQLLHGYDREGRLWKGHECLCRG